jgi:predicted DNA binding protein
VDEETNLIINVFRNANPSRVDLNKLLEETRSDKISEFGKLKIKILVVKLLMQCKIERQAIPIIKELKGLSNLESWVDQALKKIEQTK